MQTRGIFYSFFRGALAIMFSAGLIMSAGGCASKYGTKTVNVKYYPDCYQPIDQLRKDEDDLRRNTAAGAVMGGFLGAAIGYHKDGGKGAVIGAAAGAFAGGMSAYLLTDQIQQKNQAERFAAYSQALGQDIKGLENAVAAARLVNKCYENSYKTLSKQYKAGQTSKAEMTDRLKELRDGTNDANNVLAKFAAEIAQNQIVYKDIPKAEAKQGGQALSAGQMNDLASGVNRANQLESDLQGELKKMQLINASIAKELSNQQTARNGRVRLAESRETAPLVTANSEPLSIDQVLLSLPMLCPALKS